MRYKMAVAYGTSHDRIKNMMPQDHEVRMRKKTAAGSLGQNVEVMNKEFSAWTTPFCAATIFFSHEIRIRNAAWRSRGLDEKTRWPPLQGHVVRSERKRMMAARKQDGRRFRATWWGARGKGWWLPENKMAAASGPRGEEREEKDDGCQKTRWPPLQGHVVRRERKRMMAARRLHTWLTPPPFLTCRYSSPVYRLMIFIKVISSDIIQLKFLLVDCRCMVNGYSCTLKKIGIIFNPKKDLAKPQSQIPHLYFKGSLLAVLIW